MNKGFISMSLVYTFLIVFVFVNVSIITIYTRKMNYLDAIEEKINNEVILNYGNCNNINTLFCSIINDNEVSEYNALVSDGFYYVKENNKKLYFYTGNVENNYVIFAGSCYRIIRTTMDNSVRVIYYGDYDSNEICKRNTDTINLFDSSYGNVNYYSSSIKSKVEEFYENNLISYDDMIVDSKYCSKDIDNLFECSNGYSVSSNIGNGKLNYKIGLITADELKYIGLTDCSKDTYLKDNVTYTMSNDGSKVYALENRMIVKKDVSSVINTLPVITIRGNIKISKGNGNYNNPYVVR